MTTRETTATENAVAEVSMDQIVEFAEMEQACIRGNQTMQKLSKDKEKLMSHFDENMEDDEVENKVAQYKTVEELCEHLNTPEEINEFFTDKEGNLTLTLLDGTDDTTEEQDLEFKKGYLIYIKQMQITNEEMTKIIDEYNKESAKMNEAMGMTMRDFVGDYMEYILSMKKVIQDSDTPDKEKALNDLSFIESSFTFEKVMELYKRNDSAIIKSTLRDTKKEDSLRVTGSQYRGAIHRARTNASLITFVTAKPEDSFEAMYLPKNAYREGYEGLFITTLIRYFAKSYWSENVKKMHTFTIIVLQRFVEDEMSDEMRDQYIENIRNYLNIFYDFIDNHS